MSQTDITFYQDIYCFFLSVGIIKKTRHTEEKQICIFPTEEGTKGFGIDLNSNKTCNNSIMGAADP